MIIISKTDAQDVLIDLFAEYLNRSHPTQLVELLAHGTRGGEQIAVEDDDGHRYELNGDVSWKASEEEQRRRGLLPK
ncbi:hypothetical protein [Fimbriiglobus ruber]|uniref:Uncharacterized protein n=1 Tax=Fimbriiglobus ruber TaxID=1908690 RepID=A0A225E414_9BACT|nr:hypothetical protein [Fimbriiglobus ruber]OWK45538.1 hypothetical protein FRUB_01869 [Fimbriiglobus ruber]